MWRFFLVNVFERSCTYFAAAFVAADQYTRWRGDRVRQGERRSAGCLNNAIKADESGNSERAHGLLPVGLRDSALAGNTDDSGEFLNRSRTRHREIDSAIYG
jgi:hypothetical protein